MRNKKILIEAVIASVDDAIQAEKGGVDRIELNSAMFFGGLTPFPGTITEVKKRVRIPVMIMIRPRSGGFDYTELEFESMKEDVRFAIDKGVEGIVFGILNQNGEICEKRCEQIMKITQGKCEIVFHRAFDVTPNPLKSMETLIKLGFTRILTSGQQKSAIEGAGLLKEMIEKADGRIQILPGCGVRKNNVKNLIKMIGCDQVHLSGFKDKEDNSALNGKQLIHFSSSIYLPEKIYQIADPRKFSDVREEIDSI